MSGYDLTKRFEHSLSAVWPAKHNQIYTELKKLLQEGWIEQVGEGARNRKVYALTDDGREEVKTWLREVEFDHSLRFEPLLRANFLWLLPEDERARHFEREADLYRRHRDWLVQQMATLPEENEDGSIEARRSAAEVGLRFLDAMADWAEEAKNKKG